MKKNASQKIISIVVLLVILAAIVAGGYLGIMGRNTQMVSIQENGQTVERALYRQVAFIPNTINRNWTEAIVPSAQLGGGYSYTLTAQQGDMSDADYAKALKETAAIVQDRCESVLGDAVATVEDNAVVLTIPGTEYDSLIPTLITPTGDVAFYLVDMATGMPAETPLLTAKDVKKAQYSYDGTSTYYLQTTLTKSAANTVNAHLGETLYVLLDGQPIAYTTLSTKLANNVLSAAVNDWTAALAAVVCLNSDVLPFSMLTLSDAAPAGATLPGLLDGILIASAIIMLLAALFMIVRAPAAGLAGVMTLCAQIVLSCLLTALISVSTGWKLTLPALILLVACQLLFAGGLCVVVNKISAVQKHRALKQAAAATLKQSFKPLSIVYGALILLGVVLMAAFSTSIGGVLGRFVAISGVMSFVMIFVMLRVIISCFVSLKNK